MSNKQPTLFLETFGCQMNALDSQLVRGALEHAGYAWCEEPERADVVLFNTCSVRQHAEDKVYGRLAALRRVKLERPEMILGVIGCMAERDGPGLLTRMPHVDLLCGPGHLNQVADLVEEVRRERTHYEPDSVSLAVGFPEPGSKEPQPVIALAGLEKRTVPKALRDPNAGGLEELDSSRQLFAEDHCHQAYVRIQRGCDKFCTYCIVPFTRGPERSRSPKSIVEECRMLVDRGVREITLLGQTVNSYQHEENGRRHRFSDLLAMVHDVPGLDRLRFTTSFPKDFGDDVFQAMRDLPRICEYLHIPAQSGSDAVLARMKRQYTLAEYKDVLERARAHLPHVSLASDFIVGFSGETEEDFEQTIALVKWAGYKNSFIFKYSPRPGTSADRKLPDDVPEEVKKERNHRLLEVQEQISRQIHESCVGRLVEVLVEGPSKHEKRKGEDENKSAVQLTGRTRGDLICVFDGPTSLAGRLVRVRVHGCSPYTLFADVVGREEQRHSSVISLPVLA